MNTLQPLLPPCPGHRPNAAMFLSGSGSNAEHILEQYRCGEKAGITPPFTIAALVTDAPRTSRARELAQRFNLPLIAEDIRDFYHRNGEKRVSIATERGQQLRQEWTQRLREQLTPLSISFGIFAGFVPLTNLTRDFPCLNVHPGDLTYRKDGRRYLTGLHEIPVERAITEGLTFLRSSVILAGAYSGCGDDMDNGPLLGISPEVPVEIGEPERERLRQIAAARPRLRPVGGFGDELQSLARQYQETLKEHGDWVVFPPVIRDFADNRFFIEPVGSRLHFRLGDGQFIPIETVEYSADGSRELRLPESN